MSESGLPESVRGSLLHARLRSLFTAPLRSRFSGTDISETAYCGANFTKYDPRKDKPGTGTKFRKGGEIRASPRFAAHYFAVRCGASRLFSLQMYSPISSPGARFHTLWMVQGFVNAPGSSMVISTWRCAKSGRR